MDSVVRWVKLEEEVVEILAVFGGVARATGSQRHSCAAHSSLTAANAAMDLLVSVNASPWTPGSNKRTSGMALFVIPIPLRTVC